MKIPYFSGQLTVPTALNNLHYTGMDRRQFQHGLRWRDRNWAQAVDRFNRVRYAVTDGLPSDYTLAVTADPRIMKITFPVRVSAETTERDERRPVTIHAYRELSVPEDQWVLAVIEALQPLAARTGESLEQALEYEPFYVDPGMIADDDFWHINTDVERAVRQALPWRTKVGIPALTNYNKLVALLEANSERLWQANTSLYCTGSGDSLRVTAYSLSNLEGEKMDLQGLQRLLARIRLPGQAVRPAISQ